MNNKYLETIKSLDGEIYHLEYHQQRLEEVLESLGQTTIHSLKEHLKPPKSGLYRCRVLYDEKEIHVSYYPYEKRLVESLKLLYDDTLEYSKKYANRDALNKLFMLRGNCDDILVVQNGLITDTSIANIALYDGLNWCTPKKPLLKGTTRTRLLESGQLIEKDIRVDALQNYSKVALMNAMLDFDIIAIENIRNLFVR